MAGFFGKQNILRRLVLGVMALIIILGVFFLALAILDIDEDYRLHLPVNIFNTIFISAIALPLIYISAKMFIITGAPESLAMSGAQLVFSIGSLLKGWLPDTNLYILIRIYESTLIIVSLIFLIGGILASTRLPAALSKSGNRLVIACLFFTGILLTISLIILLSFKAIIPSFINLSGGATSVQDVMQAISTLFFFVSSLIYFKIYCKSRSDISYWYFIGLLFLAFGVFFISRGPVESRIAWLGRASQYCGNLCFLVAVIRNYMRVNIKIKASAMREIS